MNNPPLFRVLQVTLRTKELEKDTLKWQQRWEESNAALILMRKNHEKLQTELNKSHESLETMTNLCRALQNERKELLSEIHAKDGGDQPEVKAAAPIPAVAVEVSPSETQPPSGNGGEPVVEASPPSANGNTPAELSPPSTNNADGPAELRPPSANGISPPSPKKSPAASPNRSRSRKKKH